MSITYANARLLYDVALVYMVKVLFLLIIVPLMALYVMIGLYFDPPATMITGISIPAYIHIILLASGGFKPLFPIAVGMGSTRVQFLKSFYLSGLGAVFATILLLNVCQYLLKVAFEQCMGWSNIMHPAVLFLREYQFLSYFAIDLMVGLFLFGFTFLFYCIWHRLGTVKSFIILMALAFPIFSLYYGGVLNSWVAWLKSLDLSTATIFTLFGAAGLAALFITYPIMRNAPLQPKPRKN